MRPKSKSSSQVYPAYISYLGNKGEGELGSKQYLTTLSVQEGFVVYFKVSILCGIVLASPFILYQFWAFVGGRAVPAREAVRLPLLRPERGPVPRPACCSASSSCCPAR